MLLLNETYVLELAGYFLLAVAGVGLVIASFIGWLVFRISKTTSAGKISRVIYVGAGAFLLLTLAGLFFP